MAETGHSLLPPSSAFRWTRCTASVKFVIDNDAILPPSGGKEADEGTRAHALLTATLLHTLGQVPDNPEMGAIIGQLVRYIQSRMLPGDRLLVDQKVPLFYRPKDRGTLDVAIVGNGRVLILDLKYGVGVGVYAEENEQLASYAESEIRVLELIEEFGPSTPVELIIYQPRDRNDSEPIRVWKITREELAIFSRRMSHAAQIIESGKGTKFEPGIACKFCRAVGICKAYALQGLTALSDENVDTVIESGMVELTSPHKLTRLQRQRVLASKAALIAWLEAVENQEVAELLHGAAPMQFKMVSGKSPGRVWNDEKEAARLLKTLLDPAVVAPRAEPQLISPTQAEKLLKGVPLEESVKTALSALTDKPEGKPTLVPVTDPRQALVFNPLQGLTDLDADASALI